MEVRVSLEQNYRPVVRYRFQFNRTTDGAGPIHIPGRFGLSAGDKLAERDNRATFEAAQAVAEETGTHVEMYVMSQVYLNSTSRNALDDLIGEVGEAEARQLLEEASEDAADIPERDSGHGKD
jgi:enamine deaminase RidA (YjgF/YER057c/UK114 family)